MSVPQKICPQCRQVCPLSAAFCEGCGRQFQTTAPHQPPPDHTMMVMPGPAPIPPPPGPPDGPAPQGMPPPYPPGQPPAYSQGYPPYPPPPYAPPPYPLPPSAYGYGAPPGYIQSYPGTHSTAAPIVLSVLVGWWAGALGNRQLAKGFTILGVLIVMAFMPFVGCIALVAAWITGICDTVSIANRINRGEVVGPWQFF